MPKILVDIDADDLKNAKRILGTSKNTEVLRLAVRRLVAEEARHDLIDMFRDGVFADLGDPQVRKAAWS